MMTSMMLGGIRIPRVPEPAMVPTAKCLGIALFHHGRQGQQAEQDH